MGYYSIGIIIAVVVSQLSILALMVSVLVKQKNSITISRSEPSTESHQRVNTGSHARLYRALKKLVFYTTLSVATDVLMTGIHIMNTSRDFTVLLSINSISILSNLFLMIGTFSEPRKIFFGPCERK